MKTMLALILCVSLATLGLVAFQLGRDARQTALSAGDALKEHAALLRSNGLDAQAAELYERYLQTTPISNTEAAKLRYLLGTLYHESLRAPDRALAQFLLVKELCPECEVAEKVGRKIVQCQEELGRSRQAQRTLASLTDLAPAAVESASAGVVVARIGDRDITWGHMEALLSELPAKERASIEKDSKRLREFVTQFVMEELLHDRAMRQGYDQDERFQRRLATLRRHLLANRVREEELSKRVRLTDADIELYFRANQDRYATPARLQAAHILYPSAASAEAALDRLRAGGIFAELANAESADTATRGQGGALGFVEEGSTVVPHLGEAPEVASLLWALDVGHATGPIKTRQGYHIFIVTERTQRQPAAFADVKRRVEQDMRQEREEAAMRELLDELLKTEKAVIFEERISG